jgi:PAS domain S-box-containing protein
MPPLTVCQMEATPRSVADPAPRFEEVPSARLEPLPCADAVSLFRRLFSHSGDAALLTRPSGEFLAANAAACAVFGASEADLLLRSRRGGHHALADATDPRLDVALSQRAREGSARSVLRLRRVSGELFDAELSSVLFLDEGAEPTALLTVRDVSAQRNAERALRASEDCLEFALASAAIGHWELNLIANVARHSLIHDRCFGYSEAVQDWSYAAFLSHVHVADRPRIEAAFNRAKTLYGRFEGEFRVVWPDGSLHWLWIAGRFSLDEEGSPARVAGIIADITSRRHAADSLAALTVQTRRNERMFTSALAADRASSTQPSSSPAGGDFRWPN